MNVAVVAINGSVEVFDSTRSLKIDSGHNTDWGVTVIGIVTHLGRLKIEKMYFNRTLVPKDEAIFRHQRELR